MCGIAGLMHLDGTSIGNVAAVAHAMAAALAHRGPDAHTSWGDDAAGIGFGHRRLAIIDLSERGAQPMHSANGRYVITYNGEIYNFRDLRAELTALGNPFNGDSDTEVLLAAISEWGLERALGRLVGMFAFALFDRRERTLWLVRDRLGVKPLYWGVFDNCLLFGSELRALMTNPRFRRDVDPEAAAAMLGYSYVPAPASIFQRVSKLPPGSILTVRAGSEPSLAHYWSIEDVARRPRQRIDARTASAMLDDILRDCVQRRMIADVPLGVFLSGGMDSSLIAALAQSQSDVPVRTFTVGFNDAAYDEAPFARSLARHLGTCHTEATLDTAAAIDLVPQVADWFDEPFGDSSQLPMYLLSRMTRRHVTVALSGDGGDEVFGGYPKYWWLTRLWSRTGSWPRPLRIALGTALTAMPEGLLQRGLRLIDPGRAERVGEKVRRIRNALRSKSGDEAALALAWVGADDAAACVPGALGRLKIAPLADPDTGNADLFARMQTIDIGGYLPDDIMTKVDRSSMAVSLEAREPLLDHRLVEFVWSLPADVRRGNGTPKAMLRDVLARYVPPGLFERPKRGFIVPVGDWLRGPLRAWAEDLLEPTRLEQSGLLDVPRIRAMWQRHLSGRKANATTLWNVLMLQAWARRWL